MKLRKESEFIDGVLFALNLVGAAVPGEILVSNDFNKRYAWVEDFVRRIHHEEQQSREAIARTELTEIATDPKAIRNLANDCLGMLLGSKAIAEGGKLCDASSKPAEDDNFQPINGAKVDPWPFCIHYGPAGEEYSMQEYDVMAEAERNKCTGVKNFLCLHGTETVMADDTAYVKLLLLEAMRLRPDVVTRLVCEVAARDDAIGKLRPYYSTVVEGIKDHPIYSALSGQISDGWIASRGHLNIAILTALANNRIEISARPVDNDLLSFYLDFAETAFDQQKFSAMFPRNDIKTYLDECGQPLGSMDNAGKLQSKPNPSDTERAKFLSHKAYCVASAIYQTYGKDIMNQNGAVTYAIDKTNLKRIMGICQNMIVTFN